MTLALSPSVPVSPALSPHDLHWQSVLLDNLAQIKAELRTELENAHPGARHCIATLIARGADCRQQLARLGVEA